MGLGALSHRRSCLITQMVATARGGSATGGLEPPPSRCLAGRRPPPWWGGPAWLRAPPPRLAGLRRWSTWRTAASAAAPCDHRPRARLRCSGARVRAGRLSARARASSQVWYNYNSGSLASLVPVDGFGQLRSHGAAPMAAAFSGDGCVARLRISSTSSSLSLSGGRLGILRDCMYDLLLSAAPHSRRKLSSLSGA
jgi:hypothetical protein